MSTALPAGTVTFLFTDIEGSTSMWEKHPDAMRDALARHDALLRMVIADANGRVFKTVGDAFCAAFARPGDAIAAALRAQRALAEAKWPDATPLRVRMAVHTGVVESRDGDYFGPPVNRVARLLAAGHGGQALVSRAAGEAGADALPPDASLRDLGLHRLKDLALPEHVFELRHPALRGDFPPIRSLSTHPNNLPREVTTFVGRAKQVADVAVLLTRNRLLTLTGAGGSGKTRLALHVAAEALAEFPDGAWVADLAPLAGPALVVQATARALGVSEARSQSISETLAAHLRDKTLLIVLDNCEHVLDGCAALADVLLQRCPRVRILATSREAIGIAGEQSYRVPSLSLPSRTSSPDGLAAFESVQLFADRARLARADFALTARNAPAVASICGKLDGIPLAIELAAARMSSLSVDEIDAKLDQRFGLLTGGSRAALPRHRTLRALVDWSYDLLSVAEQRMLQSLAVFFGGWTLDAAQATCAAVVNGDVVDVMVSLSNKSLAFCEEVEGRSRYGLLDTLRQYAREKLRESGGETPARDRHRDYYLELAERARPHLGGAEQAQWLQTLEDEHDNLRAALEWCATGHDAAAGLRLCAALMRFWVVRGYFEEGRTWCRRMLAAAPEQGTRGRADTLHAAGALAYYQGDYDQARAAFEESLAIREALGDAAGVMASLNNLGNVAIEQGDYARARERHGGSLANARKLGDQPGIANSLLNLGIVAENSGDPKWARTMYEECLAIRRRVGDRWGIAVALNNLASVAFELRDLDAAGALHEEALAIRRELGDRRGIALALVNLAELALSRNEAAYARGLCAESLTIAHEIGDARVVAHAIGVLANVRAALGDAPGAVHFFAAAARLRATASREKIDERAFALRHAFASDAGLAAEWRHGYDMAIGDILTSVNTG